MKHSDFLWEDADIEFLVRSTYKVNNACQMKNLGSEVLFAVMSLRYNLLYMVALSKYIICRTACGPVYRHFLKY